MTVHAHRMPLENPTQQSSECHIVSYMTETTSTSGQQLVVSKIEL